MVPGKGSLEVQKGHYMDYIISSRTSPYSISQDQDV